MTPPFWLIKACAVLVLLALAGGYGYHHGAQRVQARWDKQVQADRDAAEAWRETNRLRAQSAASTYATSSAAIAQRVAKPSAEATYALHATICPPAGALGKPLELGDVPVPAVWLERLRDAGADY